MTYKKESAAPTINEQLVVIQNEVTTTTSLIIANLFGKSHKNVIQSIENLELPEEIHRLNFQPIFYKDKYGRKQKAYNIQRDGFMCLVMGFTGAKAMQFKLTLINAFNQMEAELTKRMYGESTTITEVRKNVATYRYKDLFLDDTIVYNVSKFRKFLGLASINQSEKMRYGGFFYYQDNVLCCTEDYVILKIRSKTAYTQRLLAREKSNSIVERKQLAVQKAKKLLRKGGNHA